MLKIKLSRPYPHTCCAIIILCVCDSVSRNIRTSVYCWYYFPIGLRYTIVIIIIITIIYIYMYNIDGKPAEETRGWQDAGNGMHTTRRARSTITTETWNNVRPGDLYLIIIIIIIININIRARVAQTILNLIRSERRVNTSFHFVFVYSVGARYYSRTRHDNNNNSPLWTARGTYARDAV